MYIDSGIPEGKERETVSGLSDSDRKRGSVSLPSASDLMIVTYTISLSITTKGPVPGSLLAATSLSGRGSLSTTLLISTHG
jgi:hypothetical protein